jgi:transaldolase
MLLFLDTANLKEIETVASWGMLDGLTTNPSLMAKEQGQKFRPLVKKILRLCQGPVSLEVIAQDAPGMIREAKTLSRLGKNVVIKIPMTVEGVKAVQTLSKLRIKTNVTLVFSANQALLAAKAGATYVSPFLGRIDDMGEDSIKVLSEIITIFQTYGFKTQVLAASIRHPDHVKKAALLGADVATVPFEVFKKLYCHPLTDAGIKAFLDDWQKSGFKLP